MMRCHFCRGDLEKSTTEYVEKMDNFIVVIENIPCDKCVQCGEAYFSDEVFGKLERILNSIQTISGVLTVTVIDYENTAA
ncbi:MAG: type II toxin-antitoxin system MqsA family antitoxin [Eubacteriales bacterium]|nr:type II toxin-antitoxin system MqsA family antitoxin [Eubacteriales bacterium]MDY4213041.1 type II toxin-antitoxin system MqsA family antitoxin [Eubacteriales bacterium]